LRGNSATRRNPVIPPQLPASGWMRQLCAREGMFEIVDRVQVLAHGEGDSRFISNAAVAVVTVGAVGSSNHTRS
jgi:hypothetical protein